jgi:vacuolar-type H+-ATPase subunit E/Vma4
MLARKRPLTIWRRRSLAEEARDSRGDLVQLGGAADRAGSIVTEQVESIIRAAESNASDIRREAERDAQLTRQQAAEAAGRILEHLEAIERPLGELVATLRREADGIATDVEHPRR